jgi:hypothetical protein
MQRDRLRGSAAYLGVRCRGGRERGQWPPPNAAMLWREAGWGQRAADVVQPTWSVLCGRRATAARAEAVERRWKHLRRDARSESSAGQVAPALIVPTETTDVGRDVPTRTPERAERIRRPTEAGGIGARPNEVHGIQTSSPPLDLGRSPPRRDYPALKPPLCPAAWLGALRSGDWLSPGCRALRCVLPSRSSGLGDYPLQSRASVMPAGGRDSRQESYRSRAGKQATVMARPEADREASRKRHVGSAEGTLDRRPGLASGASGSDPLQPPVLPVQAVQSPGQCVESWVVLGVSLPRWYS